MATKAFVLIETAVGGTRGVTHDLKQLGVVKSVDTVTGPYDLIAIVEGENVSAIGDLVMDKIQPVSGIFRIVTCLAYPK
jgi:DNA-binding Lrp family transcriptional regulator